MSTLPIARFTSIPNQTQSGTVTVEMSAFHASGIHSIIFSLDGRDQTVTAMSPGIQGYMEYRATFSIEDLNPGRHQISAIVTSNDNTSLTLWGESRDFDVIKNGYNGFFFTTGVMTKVDVGYGYDYETVSEAVATLGSALTHGGTIVLAPGRHTLDTPSLDNDGYCLTITGDGRDVRIVNPNGLERGAKNSNYRFDQVTFELDTSHTRFLAGSRDSMLALTKVQAYGLDPDGYRKQHQTIGKSYVGDMNYGIYLEDVQVENVWKGMNGVNTAKRVIFGSTTGDCFGGSPGAVINCITSNPLKDETYHSQHCDIIQLSDGRSTSNRIFAGIFSPKQQAQVGHISRADNMANIAFVNWVIVATEAERQPDLNINPDMDGMYIDGLTFIDCSINWADGQHTNSVVRNTTMVKQSLRKDPFQGDYSDVSIRFTGRMSADWGPGCTLGPIVVTSDFSWYPEGEEPPKVLLTMEQILLIVEDDFFSLSPSDQDKVLARVSDVVDTPNRTGFWDSFLI